MENQSKIPSECTLMKQGNAVSDNNLLQTVVVNAVDSRKSIGNDCNNLASGLNSRPNKEKNMCNEIKNESYFLEESSTRVQLKNNCSIFFLKELKNDSIVKVNKTTNGSISRPIAPKLLDSNFMNSGKRSLVIEPYKKRDDKRRVTHNEVERRRRDKMNSWIFKLKELIPESTEALSPTDSKAKGNGTDSKSQILIRACEYIKEMQEELKSLRETLMENDNLGLNNPQLLLKKNEFKTTNHEATYEVEIKCEPSTEETEIVKYEVHMMNPA